MYQGVGKFRLGRMLMFCVVMQRGAGEGEGAEIEVLGILLMAFLGGGRNRVMLENIDGNALRLWMRRSGHECLFRAGWILWKHFLLKRYLSTGRGGQNPISSCHINPPFSPQSLVLLPSSASEPPAARSRLIRGSSTYSSASPTGP